MRKTFVWGVLFGLMWMFPLLSARDHKVIAPAGMDLGLPFSPGVVTGDVLFLSDVRFYADMNDVYREMMPKVPPARATVGTPLMSPDALVEIMMTARARDK